MKTGWLKTMRAIAYPARIRAVQITRFGGPEVLDVLDLPEPTPGEDQQLYEVHTAGVNFAESTTPVDQLS